MSSHKFLARLKFESLDARCLPVVWPVTIPPGKSGVLLGTYGQFQETSNPFNDVGIHLHEGLDVAAATGDPVRSVLPGIVEAIFNPQMAPFSAVIIIRDLEADNTGAMQPGKMGWNYKHVVALPGLRVGDRVTEGQQIGQVANSGPLQATYGDHVHLDRGFAAKAKPGDETRDPTMVSTSFYQNAKKNNVASLVTALQFEYMPTINPLYEFSSRTVPEGIGDQIDPTVVSIDFRRNADEASFNKFDTTAKVREDVRYFGQTGAFGAIGPTTIIGKNAIATSSEGVSTKIGDRESGKIDFVVNAFDEYGLTGYAGSPHLNPAYFQFTIEGESFGVSTKKYSFDFSGFSKAGVNDFFTLANTLSYYNNDKTHDSKMTGGGKFFYSVTNSPKVNAGVSPPTTIPSVGNRGFFWASNAKQGAAFSSESEAKTNAEAAYPDDIYDITVTATDLSGNSGAKTVGVLLDNWTQTLLATNPVSSKSQLIYSANQAIKFTGEQYRPNSTVQLYRIPATNILTPPSNNMVLLQASITPIGTGTTDANGVLTANIAGINTPGLYSIVADYDGDSVYKAGLDAYTFIGIQDAGKAPAKIGLSAPNGPFIQGDTVHLIGNVAATDSNNHLAPTGEVGFFIDGDYLGSGTISGGIAEFDMPAIAAGSHLFAAVYFGDDNFDSATDQLSELVADNPTDTTLVTSSPSSLFGDLVTFTAHVAPHTTTATQPTGDVTFYSDGNVLGVAELDESGNAVLSFDDLPRGTHTITAEYIGDTQFDDSSATVSQIITNNNPEPRGDVAITLSGQLVPIDVLANDYDREGDALSVTGFTQGVHGKVVSGADGMLNYTPTFGFVGIDTFTYTVSDSNGGTATASVAILTRLIDTFNDSDGYDLDGWTIDTKGTLGVVTSPGGPSGQTTFTGPASAYTEASIAIPVVTDQDFDTGATFTQNGSFGHGLATWYRVGFHGRADCLPRYRGGYHRVVSLRCGCKFLHPSVAW